MENIAHNHSERLKVLFLSQRFLFPMDTGGKIRTGKILEKLKDIFDITVISNVEISKDNKYFEDMNDICDEFYKVEWKEIEKYTLRFYLRILVRSLSKYPITVLNDYSKNLEDPIKNYLHNKKYDLIICDFLQSSLNFRKIKNYPDILFQHNVEYIIAKRHFEKSKNILTKIFWFLQYIKMEDYERKTCKRFKGVITVSETDRKIIEQNFQCNNVFSIPTGVDTEYFSPQSDMVDEHRLVFTGSMDWLPNEDAILFFARDILWRIKEEIPQIKLTVVGRNPSAHLVHELKRYPEIEIVGWVEDVRPYISRGALYVIPLRIGGGTRIKVYEAMAMGKAVVSTHIGTEGLPVEDNKHVILADEPEAFAQAVVSLLQAPLARSRIETAAREYVCNNCSWQKVAEVFAHICWQVVRA